MTREQIDAIKARYNPDSCDLTHASDDVVLLLAEVEWLLDTVAEYEARNTNLSLQAIAYEERIHTLTSGNRQIAEHNTLLCDEIKALREGK